MNEFLRQLESCIQVAAIPDADRHRYLHLHLKGGALTFFDQQPAAVREDYDQAVAALQARYQNEQRIQLQKLLFNARKMKPAEESAQDFLTELQRLALEAYPNVAHRAAAGGRPAVAAEDRAQERTRRVREAFINGMPIKLKRFLMTQPDETTIEDLCAKASSRMIVDRLYPEDEDTAFNEVSNFSTKELLTGINELSKAHDVLKEETGKISTELKELTKTLQPTISQLNSSQGSSNNNSYKNNRNRQNGNKNNGPRQYNQQNGRNNNNNNRPNWKNNNQQNWRPPNPNWQQPNPNWRPPNPNWQQPRYNSPAQSSQKYCNNCNKFGHIPSRCWFRQQQHNPPTLPYNQYSNANASAPQPMMQTQMIPQPQTVPQWSPHFDVNNPYQQQQAPKN